MSEKLRTAGPFDIPPRPPPNEANLDARERIGRTAYELFRAQGFSAVGVDRIVAESNVAKTTLYHHFRSKDELLIAVLERHEEVWTGWLEREAEAAHGPPGASLVALFDALDRWFGHDGYEGCLFINCLLETRDRQSPVRAAAIASIQHVYELLRRLATAAGARDAESLAHQLQVLMRGAIIAAVEGNHDAVGQARMLAFDLIERNLGE
jgi:AcrR family transcriptional regulator